MNENGRKVDYLIEDEYYTDPQTGMKRLFNYFIVWADSNMKQVIILVDGVTRVFADGPTEFHVYYDARYDRETIKQEIVAAIKNNL